MEENRKQAEEIVEKVKELVKKGNVSRIVLKRGGEAVLNLPLNVGIVGTILGVAAAPWAMLITALVTFGLDCRLELVKTDGETVDINGKTIGDAADHLGETVLEKIKRAKTENAEADAEEAEADTADEAPAEDAE